MNISTLHFNDFPFPKPVFPKQTPNWVGICASNRTNGQIELRFIGSGRLTLNIYCQRDGEAEFVLLGQTTHDRFTDDRPGPNAHEPEVRRYRVIPVINGLETDQARYEIVISCRARLCAYPPERAS